MTSPRRPRARDQRNFPGRQPHASRTADEESDSSTRDGPSTSKRRRIGLACTSCRNRKSRCNGGRPTCSLCQSLGFNCVYELPSSNRVAIRSSALPDTSYDLRLRSIEETIRLLVQKISVPSPQGFQDTHEARRFPPAGISVVLNEDEKISEDGMGLYADLEESDACYFGPSSNMAFLRQISAATNEVLQLLGLGRPRDGNRNQQQHLTTMTRPTSPTTTNVNQPPRDGTLNEIRTLPLENDFLRMIRLFFKDAGMLFPYIDQEAILRTHASLKERHFVGARRSWLCLVNIILAFANYISIRPDQPAEEGVAKSEVFYSRAHKLVEGFDTAHPTLEMLQCFLLMTQYRQGTQSSDEVWDLHPKAVISAVLVRLHLKLDSLSSSTHSLEAEIRKRTFFGLLLVDRTLAMTFGRPLALPNQYFKAEMPLEQSLRSLMLGPGTQVSSTDNTVCLFTATIQLYVILGDVLNDIYGNNYTSYQSLLLPDLIQTTLSLERRLSAWKNELPSSLQRQPWLSGGSRLPNDTPLSTDQTFDRVSTVITLRYLNVRLLLHRPILCHLLAEDLCQDDSNSAETLFFRIADQNVELCEKSAVQLIEIVYCMGSDAAYLPAWWFTAYYTFNASLVLFACLVLRVKESTSTTSRTAKSSGHSSHNLSHLLVHLQHAIEISRKLGVGTKSSDRVRKASEKLFQVALLLVQKHQATSAALVPNSAAPNQESMLRISTDGSLQPAGMMGQGIDYGAISEATRLPATGTDFSGSIGTFSDPLVMDGSFHAFFGDVLGNDFGLSDFMAG